MGGYLETLSNNIAVLAVMLSYAFPPLFPEPAVFTEMPSRIKDSLSLSSGDDENTAGRAFRLLSFSRTEVVLVMVVVFVIELGTDGTGCSGGWLPLLPFISESFCPVPRCSGITAVENRSLFKELKRWLLRLVPALLESLEWLNTRLVMV